MIIEGNKLIAEFMCETGLTKVKGDKIVSYDKSYNVIWQNIMPVVEKIESFGYIVIIEGRSCYIQSHDTRSVISTAQFFDSKIETVWTAVVSFIEHYNTTKK